MPGFKVEANISRFHWGHGGNTGKFQPNGSMHVHGAAALTPNAEMWSDKKPLFAARIFVGFNVGLKTVWKLDDVVRIVKRVRKAQVDDASSSFLLQRGLYTHAKRDEQGKKVTVDEPGAQVIIVNTRDLETRGRDFKRQMLELAEALATELRQESVILEVQKGGLNQKTYGVGPDGGT
jgi:hypothetical protein